MGSGSIWNKLPGIGVNIGGEWGNPTPGYPGGAPAAGGGFMQPWGGYTGPGSTPSIDPSNSNIGWGVWDPYLGAPGGRDPSTGQAYNPFEALGYAGGTEAIPSPNYSSSG